MSTELIVILCGAGLVALCWLLLRFGKIIARWALVAGVLAAVIVLALALLSQASASREAAKAAKVASVGQSITTVVGGLVIGGLSVTLLVALVVIGWLALRLRLAEHEQVLRFPRQRQRKQLDGPVVYIVQSDEPEPVLWEVDEWTESDGWQF